MSMEFPTPLFEARLIKRYKRFLADVEMRTGPDAGQMITVHCPNPGSMMGLARPGATIWVSKSSNPKRKLAYTYELEQVDGPGEPAIVGINTMHPNKLAEEAIRIGLLPELGPIGTIVREQKYGQNSRIDLLLAGPDGSDTYVEVKNVHLMREAGHLEFPDSVTARGAKHLGELASMVEQGHRSVLVFIAQWPHAKTLGLARDLDPAYGRAMDDAVGRGVEVYAVDCLPSLEGIQPRGRIQVVLDA